MLTAPKAVLLLSILLISAMSISGCTNQAPRVAFHAGSTRVDHSDSLWSEAIRVKAGQTLEASYDLSLTEGTWGLWFTRSEETDPRYFYSAYDRSYKGKIRYTVSRAGEYVLHIESKDVTGSYEVSMRVIK